MIADDKLLSMLSAERKASIGFDHDDELAGQRTKALEYHSGVMKDVKSLPNRSAAVSTDVSDAIQTVLPDLVEIFTGGDDVATFTPQGAEDEKAARQETDVVNHVVFQKNDGFGLVFTLCYDALLSKVGITKTSWDLDEYEEASFSGQTQMQAEMLARQGEISNVTLDQVEEGQEPTLSFTLKTRIKQGGVRIDSVPPEDFTVGRDTTMFGGGLKKATYCAMRTRPRAQDLIADGYDRTLVDDLKEAPGSEVNDLARDTVNESDTNGDEVDDLRQVELVEHYLRVDADGTGKPQLWRFVTGSDEKVLLKREKVDRNPFAGSTPFPVTHRWYGRSLADLLLEVQRIKTALTRMMLDSGYFALNQRSEINMEKANEFTVADYLRNEPGVPIRSKGGAITAVGASALSFDVMGALEYVSTMSEQRTGVVRNAQGLNPDTLHDTARGQQALMGAAQKRVKLIARILAETGLKDLFLGVHHLLRKHGSKGLTMRLLGEWVEVDPSTWGSRADMTIEIGLGSGGKEQEQAIMGEVLAVQEKVISGLQGGGTDGPFVTKQNVFAALKRFSEVGGIKAPESYFTDPAKAMQQPPAPPPPDPKVIEAQGRLQIEGQRLQMDAQMGAARMQQDAQLKREEMQTRAQTEMARAQGEMTLKERQMILEAQMAGQRAQAPQTAPVRFGGGVG